MTVHRQPCKGETSSSSGEKTSQTRVSTPPQQPISAQTSSNKTEVLGNHVEIKKEIIQSDRVCRVKMSL